MVLAAFVADDFTGATDALWQFQRYGLRARLFTEVPAREEIDETLDVVGIATTARSAAARGSADMALPALRLLAALEPRLLQYKVCSTFDSSPTRGSIGAVVEAVRDELGLRLPVPVLPAQPELGRWTAFGNHFARYAGEAHRLDRHDPMRFHPATPVDEADLRRHLARQLDPSATVGGLPTPLLATDAALDEALGTRLDSGESAFVVDAMSDADLVRVGAALQRAQARAGGTLFAVGSGGLSFGWAGALTTAGPPAAAHGEATAATGPVLAVSGSCSPVTDRQIAVAERDGWLAVHLLEPDAATRALDALAAGRHTVVFTARGAATDADPAGLGERLAGIAFDAVERGLVGRLLVAGGDTSGEVVGLADVTALEIIASLDVAGLLCRTHGAGSRLDGAEVVLKGGQIGGDDFFLRVAG
jgi:3-oxoisoapionate kinase